MRCSGEGRQKTVELLGYAVEPLRKDQEFVLYRGHSKEAPSVFLLTTVSLRPAPETVKKLEHEYALREELDSAWAVRSLAISELHGQTTLLLEAPGGDTLDRFLPGPMQLTQFLRFAGGLATALGGLHERELIHKDVKPAKVLVDPAAGQVPLLGFGIVSRLPDYRPHPDPPGFIPRTPAPLSPDNTVRGELSIAAPS